MINAALDDPPIDPSLMIELALRDLDAPHLRALERIRVVYDAVDDPGEEWKLRRGSSRR